MSPTLPAVELLETMMTASRVFIHVAARSIGHAGGDISIPQYRILVLLVTRGPKRNAELAELLAVAPSSITRIVERLRKRGLVTRAAVDGDRRACIVAPTPAGRDLVAAVTERRRHELQGLLAAVPEECYGAIVQGLGALIAAAGEPDEQILRASFAVRLATAAGQPVDEGIGA